MAIAEREFGGNSSAIVAKTTWAADEVGAGRIHVIVSLEARIGCRGSRVRRIDRTGIRG